MSVQSLGRVSLPLVVVALLALWASGNIIMREVGGGWRLDLTADRIHTMAPETRALLADLPEPVAMQLFYSRQIGEVAPALAVEAERVQEFLGALSAQAARSLPLEIIDPTPFSEAEDRALAAGLTAVPLTEGGEAAYFGLVLTNSVDQRRVIPFFGAEPTVNLEARVVTLLADLATPIKPVAGLITGLPILGGPAPEGVGRPGAQLRPFLITERLGERVTLSPITTQEGTASVDLSGLDVLIWAHVRTAPPALWQAAVDWIEAGRPTLVLVDPWSEAEALRSAREEAFAPRFSDLGPLAPALGVTVDPGQSVIDRGASMRVNAGTRTRPDLVPYPAWMRQTGLALSPIERVTRGLDSVTFGTPGAVVALNPDGVSPAFTPLITTTPDATRVPTVQVSARQDPRGLMASFTAAAEAPFVLSGHIRTGPDGTPRNTVLVADTDWIDDRFWANRAAVEQGGTVTPTADNADFLVNVIDLLAGARDLSGLRGRGQGDRPFTRINALVAAAEVTFRAREEDLRSHLSELEGAVRQSRDDPEALATLQAELLATRADLRTVQRALIEDVERVRDTVTLLVGFAVPALIVLVMLTFWSIRRLLRFRLGGPA